MLVGSVDAVNHQAAVELWVLLAATPIAFATLYGVALWRDRPRDIPTVLDEPPLDTHPVDLALLWSAWRRHLSPRTAYRAELVHLAALEVIELTAIGQVTKPTDFHVRLVADPDEGIDREFVAFIFEQDQAVVGSDVLLSELRRGRDRPRELRVWWLDAARRVGARIWRILNNSRAEWQVAMLVTGGVMTRALIRFGTVGDPVAPLAMSLMLITLVGWLATTWALPARLGDDARREVASWSAFRRYLRRFSSIRDAPLAAVVIWERYLAYAVALGAAQQVERQIRGLGIEPPGPWPGAPAGLPGLAWFRHLLHRGPVRLPWDFFQARAMAPR